MKYENFSAVADLCIKIRNKQDEITELTENEIWVRIHKKSEGNLYTIGVGDFEHQFTPTANEFIQRIKDILQEQIDHLKSELAEL